MFDQGLFREASEGTFGVQIKMHSRLYGGVGVFGEQRAGGCNQHRAQASGQRFAALCADGNFKSLNSTQEGGQ